MRKSIYTYAILLAMPVVAMLTSCEPRGLKEDDVFVQEGSLDEILKAENPEGYKIYSLNEFLDTYMTEKGNFASDTCPYRDRSYDSKHDLYMFTVDTLPTKGSGIYIRGRVTTDDYAGNFYKAMVIQQIVNGEQQNLRISVDLGSAGGMYQIGQEILIRCNGLAVGRYANQPQLCVPSYNNNIYAMNASQKVGWAPGRIESSVFQRVTRMIGTPDVNKLQYDTLTLSQLYAEIPLVAVPDAAGMDKIRKADGRLVVIKGVWFTGEFDNNGTLAKCDTLHPDSSSNANVFAPTTNNVGYPQSRVISDGTNKLMCSNSEYSKFAYYYLPGADRHGVTECPNWRGSVTGILGWYEDKASDLADGKQKGYEWSVTPRGIPGIGVADVNMKNDLGESWVPKEFDPKDY
ncbi:MAG: hypothetical protein IKQ11_03235 [Paludibacteraceae bacterium]|nr:hypothetical protein [Paludibacteraceae bacterium]